MITAVTLVVCYLVGRWLQAGDTRLFTLLPPLAGRLDPRLPWTTIAPLGVGGAVLTWGPSAARRSGGAGCSGWARSLRSRGLRRSPWSTAPAGFVDPVLRRGRLPAFAPVHRGARTIPLALRRHDRPVLDPRARPPAGSADRAVVARRDRAGWASVGVAALQHVAAASAVPAALLAVRDVSASAVARRVAPFLVLAPAAVAIGSGDAVFLGVGAWAVAPGPRDRPEKGIGSGRPPGRGGWISCSVRALFLSYGLVLLAAIPVAVAVVRRRVRPLVLASASVAVVVGGRAVRGRRILVARGGLRATRREYLRVSRGFAPRRAIRVGEPRRVGDRARPRDRRVARQTT